MEVVERRSCQAELRFVAGDGTKPAVLSGYAAVFNALSSELGAPAARRFRERIAPGAFRSALEGIAGPTGENVFAYYNHGLDGGAGPGSGMPLGSTRDGSLRIAEDAHGLGFELDLPETTTGRDLGALVQRGTVSGVSFAFPPRSVRDTWKSESGLLVRTVHEVSRLLDISPTHKPAYQDTTLALRSLAEWEGRTLIVGGGEMSAEQRREAVFAALRQALGDPWKPEGTPWQQVATFPDSVVVERAGKYSSYPLTWSGRDVKLGEAVSVDQVYRTPEEQRAVDSRARRLHLAEIALDVGERRA